MATSSGSRAAGAAARLVGVGRRITGPPGSAADQPGGPRRGAVCPGVDGERSDPELQQGKWTFDSAKAFLMKEVGLSPAFAKSEVERYTGQAEFVRSRGEEMARAEVLRKVGERGEDWYAALVCPCGCKEVIDLNLVPPGRPCWTLTTYSNGSPTLSPSIWRRSSPLKTPTASPGRRSSCAPEYWLLSAWAAYCCRRYSGPGC